MNIRQRLESAPLENLRELAEQGLVYGGVRGQGFLAVDLEGAAMKIGHFAARFLDNQHAGSGVPGIEVELPESVEAATGDATQIQSCRSRAPNSVGAQSNLMIKVDVRILVPLVTGKARGHQAFGEIRGLRHLNTLLVQVGAASLLCCEQLIARGIVNHPGNSPALVLERPGT